jgi:hypothetical protein
MQYRNSLLLPLLFIAFGCGTTGTTNAASTADARDAIAADDDLYIDPAYATPTPDERTALGSCTTAFPDLHAGWSEDVDASDAERGALAIIDGDVVITIQMTRPGTDFGSVLKAVRRRQLLELEAPFRAEQVGEVETSADAAMFRFRVTGLVPPMRGFVRLRQGPDGRVIAFTAVWDAGDHDDAAEDALLGAAESQVIDCS